MIKKLILSSFVVVAFALYIFVANQPGGKLQTGATGTALAGGDTGRYRNGEYVGNVTDAFYGNLQVKAVIEGGRLSAVQFLQYPNDRPTSIQVNGEAMPILQQEAIAAQSGEVDIVTGATDSSEAFRTSLASALAQAQR